MHVSSFKSLVATGCKKLEKEMLARYKQDGLETAKEEEGHGGPVDQRACRCRIQEALGAVEECTSRIYHLLQRYARAYDQLDKPTKSATDEYEEYRTMAADVLSQALDYTTNPFWSPKSSKAQSITCADASSEMFAACSYLYFPSKANLDMAKGRLPSLKAKMTMAKLELKALKLTVQLTNSVISQISSCIIVERVLILPDSEIALKWIRTMQRPDVGVFVRNRVFEIRSIVRSREESGYAVQFGYIASHENPVDCATRALDKWQLIDHLWWTGPNFLPQPTEDWDSAYTPIALFDEKGASRPQDSGDNVVLPQNTRVFLQSQAAYTDIFHEIRGSEGSKSCCIRSMFHKAACCTC
ncbi:unnamed protein product [Heligmosomoides polygyrus]|uniref:Integrase catalytic domain-containing protein n=1 Tax=Heligmosomoides polygyrus TaxID=6339 RepID=A0A183F4D0_HELPZ|nr:unnamed protein product [Heligmosomoides polygyrus]